MNARRPYKNGMGKLIDLTGKRFERLEVLGPAERYRTPGGDHVATCWLCKCDCQSEVIILGHNLRSGRTKSCGYLRKETSARPHPRGRKRKNQD